MLWIMDSCIDFNLRDQQVKILHFAHSYLTGAKNKTQSIAIIFVLL